MQVTEGFIDIGEKTFSVYVGSDGIWWFSQHTLGVAINKPGNNYYYYIRSAAVKPAMYVQHAMRGQWHVIGTRKRITPVSPDEAIKYWEYQAKKYDNELAANLAKDFNNAKDSDRLNFRLDL